MKSGYKNRTRRSFLRHGMGLLALITLSGPARIFAGGKNKTTMKEGRIMKAAVVWFSQAGHTERNGKLIADTLKKEGLSVVLGDYRDFDRTKLATADLIIMGSPYTIMMCPGTSGNGSDAFPASRGSRWPHT